MRTNSNRAFTLIELLASMFLGTLLLLAALGVLRTLNHSSVPTRPVSASADALRLLQWDLANARRFESAPDGFTLWGFGALDPVEMTATQQPVSVRYRIDLFAGVPALMREQRLLGAAVGAENESVSTQMICSDISGVSIMPLPQNSDAMDPQPFDRNQGMPVPKCVEICLTSGGGEQSKTIVCLR